MALTDPVPSQATDVFRRNMGDSDSWMNQTSGTVTNRTGKTMRPLPVISDDIEQQITDLTADINSAKADLYPIVKFRFLVDTYEITNRNELGDTVTGETYRYIGATLPFNVTPATNPVGNPDFVQVIQTDHNNLTNRNAVGAHDASAIDYSESGDNSVESALRDRAVYMTLAEAQTATLEIGQYVILTDFAQALYLTVAASDDGGSYKTGLQGGLKLRLMSYTTFNEDNGSIDTVIGDQTYSAAEIGDGSILAGGYTNNLKNRMPGTRQLRAIIWGYDNEIAEGTILDDGGLACSIVTSHHSTISGDSTHTILSGGSYLTCEGGDYNGVYGGTRNNIKLGSDGSRPTHSFIFGGRDCDVYGPNGGIFASINSYTKGEFSSVRAGRNSKAEGNFVNVTGADNESRAGTLGNGQKNTISGGRFIIIDSPTRPVGNTASGGEDIQVIGVYNNVGGGYGHRVGTMVTPSTYSVIGGGLSNTVTAETAGTVSGGRDCIAEADYSGVTHGRGNKSKALYSRSGTYQAVAKLTSADTIADGAFSAAGDAQSSVLVRKTETTSGGAQSLGTLLLDNNTTWMFQVNIVARRTDATGENAAYVIQGCIKKDSTNGSAAIVGTPIITDVTGVPLSWSVSASADTSLGGLRFEVIGEVGKTVRWVARIKLSEVSV